MNVEQVREYCLSLPLATEDFPFDEDTLAFRVLGRIFAMIDLSNTQWFVLKCQPDYAVYLRDRHPEIRPAWHMNKRHWNQIELFGTLENEQIEHLISHSYAMVVKKCLRREKELHPEVKNICPSLPSF